MKSLLTIACAALCLSIATAQVPGTLSYQGILVTATGAPVTDGTHAVKIYFYKVASGGSSIFDRGPINVTTFKGMFTLILGTGVPNNTVNAPLETDPANTKYIGNTQYYLELEADGSALPGRVQLTTVPHALTAQNANAMDAAGLTGSVDIARIQNATTLVTGLLTSTDWNTFNNKLGSIPVLGGDISGALGGVTVDKIKGRSISSSTPTNNQVLQYNSGTSTWNFATLASGGSVTNIATGTGVTGGPITTTGTISLSTSGVTASTYGSTTTVPQIAVDVYGRITAASNQTIPSASSSVTGLLTSTDWTNFNGKLSAAVTNIATGTGLTGGPITTTGTISLNTSGVTASTYGTTTTIPQIAVDVYGRITAASNQTIPSASSSVTGLLTSTDWTTFNGKLGSGTTAGGDLSGTYPNPTLAGSIPDTKLNTISTAGKVLGGAITSGTIGGSTAISTSGNITGGLINATSATASPAVYGYNSSTGYAVSGVATAGHGVYGTSGNVTKAGVYGVNDVAGGYGVYGGSVNGYPGIFMGGNVGIGTATPARKLHIQDSPNGQFGLKIENTNTAGTAAEQRIEFGSGAAAIVLFNPGYTGNANIMRFFNNTAGGSLDFVTNASNRMTIANDGSIGIGTAAPVSQLHVVHNNGVSTNGITIANAGGGNAWRFYTPTSGDLWTVIGASQKGAFNATTGNYAGVSDRRRKKDIVLMGNVLSSVLQLKPSLYHFKEQSSNDILHMGFIAQDVLELFPSLVNYSTENDTYTLDYSGFGVLAIQSIHEQQEQIEDLKKQIEDLKKIVENLIKN